MMGRRKSEQGQLFYAFDLDAAIPSDHLARRIAAVLDLSWVHTELAPHCSPSGPTGQIELIAEEIGSGSS